jgi:hypothetical protein
MYARFAESFTQDLMFNLVEAHRLISDPKELDIPHRTNVSYVADAGQRVMLHDEFDGERVVCVDPERQLIGMGGRGRWRAPGKRTQVRVEPGAICQKTAVINLSCFIHVAFQQIGPKGIIGYARIWLSARRPIEGNENEDAKKCPICNRPQAMFV